MLVDTAAKQKAGGKYRPDIDGLRAIAIAPVVLYHFNFKIFSGGFVGVDVFFVISGYLITRIILDEIERKGTFSFLHFYERRVRRIIPPLVVMMAVTAVAGYFLFLPVAFENFGKSVMAASLFVANIFFWNSSGYFSPAAEKLPLLHTWSLAVEEQFYILFPPFLIVMTRWWQKAVLPLIALGVVFSFASSAYFATRYPQYVFYLAPFRAWELGLGALISLGVFPPISNNTIRGSLAALGLGLIVYAILGYSTRWLFPGVAGFLACAGAALLIHTGSSGPSSVRTMLSARLPVALGLISYSLYLWHWPLIVFAKYISIGGLSFETSIFLIAASIGLSVLSWRYIETPIRRRVALHSRPRLFAAAAVSTAILLACGAVLKLGNGLPWRMPADVVALESASHDNNFDALDCHDKMQQAIRADGLCMLGDKSVRGSWMVWGDSVAWALKPAIGKWMRENGESGWISTRGGCPPFLGVVRRAWEACKEPNAATLAFVDRHKVDKVLFAAAWSGYPSVDLKDEKSVGYSDKETRRVLDDAVDRTFAALFDRNIKIYLFESLPGAKMNVPETMARAKYFKESVDIRFSLEEYKSRNKLFDEAIERNSRYVTSRFDPAKVLCSTGKCEVVASDGSPLYSDANHPSSGAIPFYVSILRQGYVVPGAVPGNTRVEKSLE